MYDISSLRVKYSCYVDVCGFVHHSIIHIENPTRCHSVPKFYFIFIWSPTSSGRHTAHHQEPKTALAASCFACVEGCWTCSYWTLSGRASYKYEIKFWYTVASCWIFYMNYSCYRLHIPPFLVYVLQQRAVQISLMRWIFCSSIKLTLWWLSINSILLHRMKNLQ